MSQNQFDALMGAIQALTAKVDNIEAEIVNITGELQKIERWTNYNANHDVMANLPATA
jgi:hypothetical protein